MKWGPLQPLVTRDVKTSCLLDILDTINTMALLLLFFNTRWCWLLLVDSAAVSSCKLMPSSNSKLIQSPFRCWLMGTSQVSRSTKTLWRFVIDLLCFLDRQSGRGVAKKRREEYQQLLMAAVSAIFSWHLQTLTISTGIQYGLSFVPNYPNVDLLMEFTASLWLQESSAMRNVLILLMRWWPS